MGRFHDLWASGKFAVKRSQEFEREQMEQAVQSAAQLAPEYAVPEDSRQIFDALKAKRGQETGRWLNGLVPANAEKPMEAQAASANAFDDVVLAVDKLCKEFVELAFEFNKKAVGTNLYVSVEKPKLHEKRNDDVWYRPVEKTYLGRLTTRDWALIVRGSDEKVSIFVVQSAMVMAFENDNVTDQDMPPFMLMQRTASGWTIAGEAVSVEAMPQLAKELFGDLIRLSSGTMSNTELLSTQGKPLTLGENIAVGYNPEQSPVSPAVAQVMAPAPGDKEADQVISKACDIVDEIIEQELKKLYAKTAQIQPGTAESTNIRRQISATETFHTKILDAFKEYTQATLMVETKDAPAKAQLLK